VLPAARPGTDRSLYVFRGSGLKVAGRTIPDYHRVRVRGAVDVSLAASGTEVEMLLLQGRPIAEPVARHGPFVRNTHAEIAQAYEDYRATSFGEWPWERDDPVHDVGRGRFAQHPDGRLDTPV
jgi:quercetin 2,3-dioxygenase